MIDAHESALSHIELSPDGSKLATLSRKGTIIRVFHTRSGTKIHELRREDEGNIVGISITAAWLGCTSTTAKLTIYSLQTIDKK